MNPAEKKSLLALLDELRGTVEELLLAGLTTASKSTVERMNVTFKEASRMKLLRLGLTLRLANEEISRFTSGSELFSAKRFAFFLSRTWLLAEAMRRSVESGNDAEFARRMVTPATQPLEKLKVVALGVGKRAVRGASAQFEFRLRALENAGPADSAGRCTVQEGEALVWSCVFPMPKDGDLPPEAFLHLPQKQKFKPSMFLERNVIEIAKCAVSRPAAGPARLALAEGSELKAGPGFKEWERFWKWEVAEAARRLGAHRPTPMDLEVELHEEAFLHEWEPGKRQPGEVFDALPMLSGGLPFEARLDKGLSGQPLHGVMTKMAEKKTRPPLYGIAHYESCRLVFQPLSVLGKEGIEYLTVSRDKISQAELVKAMKFTRQINRIAILET